MDNDWRRSQDTNPRDIQINKSCKNFRGRDTFILSPWTELDCRHRLSLSLSWNSARSTSKNNSENCPILCLSNGRPTWDIFTLHDKKALSTQKHLGSNGTSIGRKIVSRILKLFSDWCSELREIRTMLISRFYFENGCTNLRLHIFKDASEEAMCIVAYLQDEATLKHTIVIGKCPVAPIRNTTIPKLELQDAVYGVCLRKHILRELDVKVDKTYLWTDSSTVLQWLQ